MREATPDPPADALRLCDLAVPELCRRAMARHLEVEPELDRRGQAAYLINRLANLICGELARLDLAGCDPSGLEPADVAWRNERREYEEDGELVAYLHHDLWLARAAPAGTASDHALAAALRRLFEPAVAGAAQAGPLSPAALWRLVSDAVAAGYLNVGKAEGRAAYAMRRSTAILDRAGPPLSNPQLRFVRLEASAEETRTGRAVADWFRLRGGCCRWYTAPTGGYCGTCVLRKDREDWIRAAMIRLAASD
ncbi:MAG: (2Fe-2S)-binding protein [Paracoccaceae bacterium]